MRFEKEKPLSKLTTLGIGGKASFFVEVKKEEDLKVALREASDKKMDWYVLGSGSNIVASDKGFEGLIIKIGIKDFKKNGRRVYVGAGNNLLDFIKKINGLGLAGMEKMAGIPGTIAGAIYGNAGAYGTEIRENITRVKIFDGEKFRWIKNSECRFGYRTSGFKKNKDWIIVGAEFSFGKGKPAELLKISRDTIKLREKKYKPGLLCPGSFFKNIILKNLKPEAKKELLAKIDNSKIMFGKLPSGYLLEEVGAKGMSSGKIKVAEHHGNLFYNAGGGTAHDIKKLAVMMKDRVLKKFGINLEEEVQYLG